MLLKKWWLSLLPWATPGTTLQQSSTKTRCAEKTTTTTASQTERIQPFWVEFMTTVTLTPLFKTKRRVDQNDKESDPDVFHLYLEIATFAQKHIVETFNNANTRQTTKWFPQWSPSLNTKTNLLGGFLCLGKGSCWSGSFRYGKLWKICWNAFWRRCMSEFRKM